MRLPHLARVAATLAVVWLAVDVGLPLVAMWMAGATHPVILPGFARALYLVLLVAGALVYLSASNRSLLEVRAALDRLFAPPARTRRATEPVRVAVLVALPLLAGFVAWQTTRAGEATPTSLRTQHPAMPQAWEAATNPLRALDEPARRAAATEGREIFQIACRPCHGAAGDGRGPMARGFRLKPADFTDAGTIATVVEAYAFWRVSEGAPGLPAEATPWDSAMPAWKHDLAEVERWKAVLGAYDTAGVEPRKPEGGATTPPPGAEPSARETDDGARIYLARCAACHGERGDGRGPVAPYLDPAPRDFTAGVYKLRTTESGQPPTDDDLLRVVARGVPGTAMPAWTGLSERERRLVVAYVKRFSDAFATKPAAIGPAKTVDASPAVVARGREVYRTAKCWECHGEGGRADGPSAATLKDDAGERVVPANLTKAWRFKGGRAAEDVFMRLTTGMDGTPMPSYADTLPEEDRWAVAHYVRSLAAEADGGVVLRARWTAGDLPRAVDDARWRDAPPLSLPLAGQVVTRPRWQNHAVDEVTARALFNDHEIALLLEWDDPTRSVEHVAPGPPKLGRAGYVLAEERAADLTLRDALRVQLARPGTERPHFLLGHRGRPVVLWHWRADTNAVTVERAEGPDAPPVPLPGARVEGHATWMDGRWRLVLTRGLAADDRTRELTLVRGALIPFAVHAWDGGRGERDLLMSMSSWSFIFLEPAGSPVAPFVGIMAAAIVGAGELLLMRRRRRPGRR
ncbi:MAG: c-type cytochrome [Candidatus Rokubacteria bacterium]|nr:c-type cytochrome [Candidatus Rokubacteria bacterium]